MVLKAETLTALSASLLIIICIVIKSFSYIQMKYQIFDQNFFADIGKNAVDIQANADEIDSNIVRTREFRLNKQIIY